MIKARVASLSVVKMRLKMLEPGLVAMEELDLVAMEYFAGAFA